MTNDTHESITLSPVTTDTLQKFIFDNAAVRGELVEISDTWREIQNRHDYPPAVRTVLGEMVAAAALLSANLKFNGAIIMQIHGDGPVRLMVAFMLFGWFGAALFNHRAGLYSAQLDRSFRWGMTWFIFSRRSTKSTWRT